MNTEAFTKYESEVRSYCRHFPVVFKKAKDAFFIDENNEKYINTKQKILIECLSKNNDKMLTGRTDTNKVVVFEPEADEKIGDIINVEIQEAHKWYLKGKIIH